jgi:hypothetical protein
MPCVWLNAPQISKTTRESNILYNILICAVDKEHQCARTKSFTNLRTIIICGDININYLVENEQKKQLDNLLLMYNLISIVNFPTRINNTSASALDNFFIDASCCEDFSIIPFWNDLSDQNL